MGHTIHEAIERHAATLLAIDGVTGVAQGIRDGRACIRVFVATRAAARSRRIPHELDGHPVHIERGGPFYARPGDA